MKYLFVLLSIVAIWLAVIFIIMALDYKENTLTFTAIIMTVILYEIGIGGKK